MADQPQGPAPNATPSPQPPPELPEGTIHLKVKVPHGNLPASVSASTFSLGAVPVTSRIGDVRRQIQQTIPTNPATTRQRLLYGGRSLYDDAETLQDALNTRRNPEQKEYVIHLIVRAEAGTEGRTGSPARADTPSAAQLHQNALNQHHQLHQRLHQHNVALGQQNPFPFFNPSGMQGPHAVPMEAQIVNPQDPAAIQRMMQQQAQQANGQQQPNGTGEANTSSTRASAPPAESGREDATRQPPPGEATARPQSQPPQAGQTHHQQQPQPHIHQGPGNFRVEARGPNGEVFEYQQHTFNIPHAAHPSHRSGYAMTTHAPPQQGQPGGQPHGPPRHFGGPPGWVPGMPAIPAIPQFGMPHAEMPHMGMPMQGQIPLQLGQHQAAGGHTRGASLPVPPGASALDRARNDMAEIRRTLDELRGLTGAAFPGPEEERRTQEMIGQMEQRARNIEGYIDPFGLAGGQNTRHTGNTGSANTTARGSTPSGTDASRSTGPRLPPLRHRLGPLGGFSALNAPMQPTNNQEITAYLLSSPQGPQAIIYTPQHGTYTTATQPTSLRPTPTVGQSATAQRQQEQQGQDQQRDPAAQAAAHRAIQDFAAQRLAGAQAIAAGQNPGDPMGPIQPLLGHFWLLLRILIFAYFLMGSNMGLTKLLMLAGVGFAFWMFRVGVLGNPEVMNRARAWWDGIVGLPPRPAAAQGAPQQAGQQPQPNQGPAQQGDNAAAQQPAAQDQRLQNRMPTPEQVAQRLLDQNAAQNRGWLREQIRPVERAVALFVASLWPGIGEAHVRAQREAREAEERRVQEAEVEARRRAEEEAERDRKEGEGTAGGVEGQGEGSGVGDGVGERAGEGSAEMQAAA